MEDWSYNCTKFCGDPDMPLPDGEDFDDEGKNQTKILILMFLIVFSICMLITFLLCMQMLDQSD